MDDQFSPEEFIQKSTSRHFLILLATPKGELLSWTERGYHNTEIEPADGWMNMQPFRRESAVEQYYEALRHSKDHGAKPQLVELPNF